MMTLYLAIGWAVRRPGGGRQWDYSMLAPRPERQPKGEAHHREHRVHREILVIAESAEKGLFAGQSRLYSQDAKGSAAALLLPYGSTLKIF